MRYTTFRAIVLMTLAGAGAGGWFGFKKLQEAPPAQPAPRPQPSPQPQPTPQPAPRPEPQPAPSPTPMGDPRPPTPVHGSDEEPLRDFDRKIFDLLGKPAGWDKLKDALPGSGIHVALYSDPPSNIPTRVKIDRNKNDRWDEKWEVDGTTVTKRLVSSKDDENYDQVWKLAGDIWVLEKSGLNAPAPRKLEAEKRVPLRDIDKKILAILGKPASGDKIKDALGKTGPKVNVNVEGGSVWNRAKIDFERNEKWNEKIDLMDGGRVKRRVAPKDDEVYTEEWTLDGDAWVQKK